MLGHGAFVRALRFGLKADHVVDNSTERPANETTQLMNIPEMFPLVAHEAFRGFATSPDPGHRSAVVAALPSLAVAEYDFAVSLLRALEADADAAVAHRAAIAVPGFDLAVEVLRRARRTRE